MAQQPQTPRIFLDSSVIFAASSSATGASRLLILLGEMGLLQIVASEQVFEEVKRNLQLKAPGALDAFERFRKVLSWEIVPYPSREQVLAAEQHIAQKDAPILVAAMNARVNRLITLDVRDFKTEQVLQFSRLMIQTPGELVKEIRNVLARDLSL